MTEFKTLRGMRDLLPDDAGIMIYVQETARKVAKLYGYKEIITPVVESYELLSAKAGDEVRSRMFMFKDLGGRDVALRPEFTASVARLVATSMRNEPKPFRIFSMGSAYRYDEPQRGRYREFWQSDFELIGSPKPEADAEILMLTDSLIQKVGLKKFSLKVGHVGIIRGILGQEKVTEKSQNAIMQLMDKKQYDDALKLVEDAGTSKKCLSVIRELVECKGKEIVNVLKKIDAIVKDYENSVAAVENLRTILDLVKQAGYNIDLTVDAGFARGLEYYTGMIFEIFAEGLDIALGGGGRYDKLVELFGGQSTPAVGVAHGIDRMTLAMETQKTEFKTDERPSVLVVSISDELKIEALRLARILREADLWVEVEVMGRKMTKALEDADRRKIGYVIIVGEREFREESVVLRDLSKREQRRVPIK
ncbi:MAG TPA: histidine--tRNA ligase, partial [Patescibacteria group bacterium]|nr:histidine--tRNA ligase [Patescibacteria group bacterium]